MLNDGILILCLVNFGYIALLPRKFFKQGAKLGVEFWATAAPLFASPACLALAFFNILPPLLSPESPWGAVLTMIGVIFCTLSVLLLGMSIGTHRVPLHMFHDKTDSHVSHLVTYGPYRFIRHPIYSSYLFALVGALLCCVQIGTLLCFVYAAIVLSKTAITEERRLCASPELGEEYREYIKTTGRFLPPLSALRLSDPDSNNSRQAPGAVRNSSEFEHSGSQTPAER